jgi:predicted GNAT family acetyltransferase
MMHEASPVGVRDNREAGRYELAGDGTVATLDYRTESRLVLDRVHIPQSLDESGHRLGGQLVRAAIARARAEHRTIVAVCPFVRRWLRDNPDAWVGVPVDWPDRSPDRWEVAVTYTQAQSSETA